jgi:hypothetical protein
MTDQEIENQYKSYGGGLEKFENDLMEFIKKHPYTTSHQAFVQGSEPGKSFFAELHTVNGEFERLEIKINYIS